MQRSQPILYATLVAFATHLKESTSVFSKFVISPIYHELNQMVDALSKEGLNLNLEETIFVESRVN